MSNHDSRSPFFSLFSLTYSKAIISSCFHYQIAGANKQPQRRSDRDRGAEPRRLRRAVGKRRRGRGGCRGEGRDDGVDPVYARRQLFDLSDDMATRVNVQFYSDAPDALLKALLE